MCIERNIAVAASRDISPTPSRPLYVRGCGKTHPLELTFAPQSLATTVPRCSSTHRQLQEAPIYYYWVIFLYKIVKRQLYKHTRVIEVASCVKRLVDTRKNYKRDYHLFGYGLLSKATCGGGVRFARVFAQVLLPTSQ